MKALILSVLMCFLSVPLAAHSVMDKTRPGDGAVLAHAPEEIVLNFDNRIRLTRIEMRHDRAGSTDLDLNGYKKFETTFAFPFITKGPGLYEIIWRGLGVDGHVMQGRFSFELK